MPFFYPIMKISFQSSLLLLICFGCASKSNDISGPYFHFVPAFPITSNLTALIKVNENFELFYPEDRVTSLNWRRASSDNLMSWTTSSHTREICSQIPMHNPKKMVSATIVRVDLNRSIPCQSTECLLLMKASWSCNDETKDHFESMLISNDIGKSWAQSDRKPIVDLDIGRVRDPGIFYYSSENKWILMAPTDQKIHFFESVDLTTWKHVSMFGPLGNTNLQWENPEMIWVPISKSTQGRWVLMMNTGHSKGKSFSAVQYFIGTFDGKVFTPENGFPIPSYLDYGRDFLGAIQLQTKLQDSTSQAVVAGKIGNLLYGDDLPNKRLNGMLSLPRKLFLSNTEKGLRLMQKSAVSLINLGGEEIRNIENLSGALQAEVKITMPTSGRNKRGIQILKTASQSVTIGYDPDKNEIFIDRSQSGFTGFHPEFAEVDHYELNQISKKVELVIFLDQNLLEVYIQNGEAVITALIFPKDLYGKAEWFGLSQDGEISGYVLR